jgi:arylsulfatase A-like enzyme
MTEAMDTEIGRLLQGLQGLPGDELERTVIVFVGDNGTPTDATTAPFNPQHAKGTPFEGGVNVPLIVKGPGVAAGAECAALVNTTDLYATFCELGGRPAGTAHDPVGPDSVSLVPYLAQPELPSLRSWVYAEAFGPNGFGPYVVNMRTVREERYKLIWRMPVSTPAYTQFFDLQADPFEEVDLLREGPLTPEQQTAHDWLWDVLDSLR